MRCPFLHPLREELVRQACLSQVLVGRLLVTGDDQDHSTGTEEGKPEGVCHSQGCVAKLACLQSNDEPVVLEQV